MRIGNIEPSKYMRQVLYHALTDIDAKQFEYGSNSVKVSISFSYAELAYLYECVAERGDDNDTLD